MASRCQRRRVLAAAARSIQDYPRTEVFLDQLRELRDALLRTSILDRLYGGLVDALTERADGAVLAEFLRRNMFATQPGTHPPSHPYHRVLGEPTRHELTRSATDDVARLHPTSERLGLSCPHAIGASGLAFILALRGELRASERMARTALAMPPYPGQADHVHCGFAYVALAMLDIEWKLLDDAGTNLRLAAVSCDPRSDPALTAIISIVRADLLDTIDDRTTWQPSPGGLTEALTDRASQLRLI